MIKFSTGFSKDSELTSPMKPSLIGCLAKCGPWRKGKRPESICYSQGECFWPFIFAGKRNPKERALQTINVTSYTIIIWYSSFCRKTLVFKNVSFEFMFSYTVQLLLNNWVVQISLRPYRYRGHLNTGRRMPNRGCRWWHCGHSGRNQLEGWLPQGQDIGPQQAAL